MRNIASYALIAAVLAAASAGCRKPVAAIATPGVPVVTAASIPEDPLDDAWSAAPVYAASLQPQDMVEPRSASLLTETIDVRAITDGRRISLRLEWLDGSEDNRSVAAEFVDACAVQLPATIEASVPAPQMGEPGRPVEIVYWNAAWQAIVVGRGDSIRDLYPNASIDHYPFEANSLEPGSAAQRDMALLYAPARALGNMMTGPRDNPVQDLVAEGPGTITPAASTTSSGRGRRTNQGWAVVLVRRLPEGLLTSPNSQIAFAVWDGEKNEVGARKMRSGWIPIAVQTLPIATQAAP